MFGNRNHVTFFGEMSLDISKELPDLWKDVYEISRKNGYIVDVEFNVISLYQELDSRLHVTKIVTGRDRRVKKIIMRVFEKTGTAQEEEHEMIGIDGMIPIWKRTGSERNRQKSDENGKERPKLQRDPFN